MENLETRIKVIEERNRRVELDKKWETSFTRLFSISLITYIVAVIVFYMMNTQKPFLNALVPVLGFILSTQSLPVIKKLWIRNK